MNLQIVNQLYRLKKEAAEVNHSPLVEDNSFKQKEIVVWIRLQENKDKQQIIDAIKLKFNVDDSDAARLYKDSCLTNEVDDLYAIEEEVTQLNPPSIKDFLKDIIKHKNNKELLLEKYDIKDIEILNSLILKIQAFISLK